MSSIKKLMCNPPAEYVALHGDPRVAGMFAGAGDAIHEIEDEATRNEFAHNVTMIEQEYIDKRESIAMETQTRMQVQFDWVLSKVETSAGDARRKS